MHSQPIATHFDFLSKPRAALRFWCEERCVGRNSFGRFCRFANTTFQRFDRYLPRYHVLVFFSSSSLWPSPPPLLPLLDIVFFLLQFDRLTHLRVRVHKRRVSRTQMKEEGKRGGEREGEVRVTRMHSSARIRGPRRVLIHHLANLWHTSAH